MTAGSPRPSAPSTRRWRAPQSWRAARTRQVDLAGRLRTARRQLDALREQAASGSLGLQETIEDYGVIARGQFGVVRDLDSGRPSRATSRAANAYVALVQAEEGAEMERVTQAAALVRGTESVRVRGVIVEADALDEFRQYAARDLVADLDALLGDPAGSTVDRVRDLMVRNPASVPRRVSLERWLAASGTRIRALRRLERDTAGELSAVASTELDAARVQGAPRRGRVVRRAHPGHGSGPRAAAIDHAAAGRGLRGSTDALGRAADV